MLRVKISDEPSGGVSVTCADPAGALVLTVGSLGLRALELAAADGASRPRGTLLGLEWEAAPETVTGTVDGWVALGDQRLGRDDLDLTRPAAAMHDQRIAVEITHLVDHCFRTLARAGTRHRRFSPD